MDIKKNIPIFIVILPVILFLTTIFYWNSYRSSIEGSYDIMARINNLKLLDNDIDRSILSKREHLNYDIIVIRINYFQKQLDNLRKHRFLKENSKKAVIDEKFRELQEIFDNKADIIDSFKSKQAVWYNSLRFLLETNSNISIHNHIAEEQNKFHKSYNKFISILALKSKWEDLYSKKTQQLVKDLKVENLHIANSHQEEKEDFHKYRELMNLIYMHSNKILTLSQEIGESVELLSQKKLFEKLTILENYLIKEFDKKGSSRESVFHFLTAMSIVFASLLILLFYREKKLQEKLNSVNRSLEKRVQTEVAKNREKDKLMFQQSKMASMGEMIGNIAHQWRQPINALAIIIQDYENAYDFEELDHDYLVSNREEAMKQIDYMSKTIDDFRHFFQNNNKKERFSVNELIDDTISLMETSLNSSKITLDVDMRSEVELIGVRSQYMQVIINLIKNAKDALIETEVENPSIAIKLYEDRENINLSVIDNGKGVDDSIIDKIFEPYFTTKHQSIGTGIGLYMSKLIIEDSFNGKLELKNSETGAKFITTIPKA